MMSKTVFGYLVVILLTALAMLVPAPSEASEQKKPLVKDSITPAGMQQGVPSVALGMPDLVISDIDFQVVQNTVSASGASCQIYNVIATVKNQGTAAARHFNVTILRHKVPGDTFELACQACTIAVAGLDKGASMKLDPRQFNNCSQNISDTFRVVADPAGPAEPKGKVSESNENNNSLTRKYLQPIVPPEKKKPGY